MVDWNALAGQAVTAAQGYAPKLIGAIVVLILGLWIIGIIRGVIKRTTRKQLLEVSLQKFIVSLTDALLKVLLAITVIGMLGVQMTSFIAILAAAGFAIGLALQGSLANFAGGVLILVTKPFKVGHFVQVGGEMGTVHEIGILHTVLKSPDNKTIIMPNGPAANSTVTNFSMEDTRRVDLVFGIGYDDDLKKAKKELEAIFSKSDIVLEEQGVDIRVKELGASSVDLNVRFWVDSSDYWTAITDLREEVKLAFDKKKISFPYPQTDVHLHK